MATPNLDRVLNFVPQALQLHQKNISGLQAYLVLSGSTLIESVADYVYQPTRVLGSVADLVEELKSGKPSSRLDSPVFADALPRNHSRLGNRHQTDFRRLHKPRPRAPMTR